jgi:excisionase family DNA binding protein
MLKLKMKGTYSAGPQLLTIDQTAARLGVSKSTVEKWLRSKALASFKMGRLVRIDSEELARFIAVNTVKPRRPEWLTVQVEDQFWRRVREIIINEIARGKAG